MVIGCRCRVNPDPLVPVGFEEIDQELYVQYKTFVRGVRNFVRHHDPTKPVVPVPLWPGLADVTRTWRAGAWRERSLH
jgi:hypothetical protein